VKTLALAAAALVALATPTAYADPVGSLTGQLTNGVEALTGGPDPAAVAAYDGSWTHRALQLQEDLGASLPLAEVHVLSTHNSFNTMHSPLPGVAELDPNQVYELGDQLRMDVRHLELDTHALPGLVGQDAGACHEFCTTERPLSERLQEVRDWLDTPGNEDEVVFLEGDVGGGYADPSGSAVWDAAAADFQQVLGDELYRPAASGSCQTLDPTLSTDDIRASGARVVLVAGCGQGTAWTGVSWSSPLPRQQEVFKATSGSPTCDPLGPSVWGDGVWKRQWEDRTVVGSTQGAGVVTPEAARELDRCGLNFLSVDQLRPADGRLDAFVWSWAEGQPSTGDCAATDATGRFVSRGCGTPLRVACRAADRSWSLTRQTVTWDKAQQRCAAEKRGTSAVPSSAQDAQALREAAGGTPAWLDYRATGGTWVPEAAGVS
jgi:hypothetical protein